MNTISHLEARALFRPFIDAELDPDSSVQLKSHLATCGDCQVGWGQYQRVVNGLRSMPAPQTPPNLAGRILRRARWDRRLFLRASANLSFGARPDVGVVWVMILAALVWFAWVL